MFKWKQTPKPPKPKPNKQIELGAPIKELMSADAYKRVHKGRIRQTRWANA